MSVYLFYYSVGRSKLTHMSRKFLKGPIHAQIFCQIIWCQIIWHEFARVWLNLMAWKDWCQKFDGTDFSRYFLQKLQIIWTCVVRTNILRKLVLRQTDFSALKLSQEPKLSTHPWRHSWTNWKFDEKFERVGRTSNCQIIWYQIIWQKIWACMGRLTRT